jgi:ABC-2 type transport system permease protein
MLKGADLATISREMAALALFVGLYAAVALLRFRRTLD